MYYENTDEISSKLELTPEQKTHWNKIVKSVKAYKQAGGKFYTQLEKISAYNGRSFDEISDTLGKVTVMQNDRGKWYNISDHTFPCITDPGFCGFSDDLHAIKERILVK